MSLSSPKPNILISGAGIAGPCLAYWLSKTRLNASITVLERSPVPRPTGQAIDIRGAAISIIRKMGLEPEVRARGTTEIGTKILNRSGGVVIEIEKGSFTAEYEILRADLCGLFMDATTNLEGVKYVFGDYVVGLEQGEKSVDVSFAGGKKETYDLVVGADGSTSKIRSMILDKTSMKDSYHFIGQYIAYFSIPSIPSDTKHWYWYNAPNGRSDLPKGLGLMLRPHRNPDTVGVYMSITTPGHGKRDEVVEEAMNGGPEAQKRVLHKYFANAGWQAQRILKGMDTSSDFYMSRAAKVNLPKWHAHRSVLIGDAAHATFGVGTSLAIHGAYMLAGELGKIQSNDEIPAALDRYEDMFRPIFGKQDSLPPGYPQMAFPQTTWGLNVRDAILWLLFKSKVHKLMPDDNVETDKDVPEYQWVGVEK